MYLYVFFGFIFLTVSADILVRGAVGLAQRLNVSPLVIGVTIISFGTSLPEFLVSMDAVLIGTSAMALRSRDGHQTFAKIMKNNR